jgi:phage gp36-like protein
VPAYTALTDLRYALAPGGGSDPATASSLTDVELGDAIEEASAEVDAELAALYAVPLDDPVPPIVARITRDIAAYLATLTHRRGVPLSTDDPARLRGDQARALLRRIGSGQAGLVGVGGTSDAADGSAVANPYSGEMWAPPA